MVRPDEPAVRGDPGGSRGRWASLRTGLVVAIVVSALAGCAGPRPEPPSGYGELERVFHEYDALLGPKAFAIAFDGRRTAYGLAHSGASSEAAGALALDRCRAYRSRIGISTPCAIYAVNDEIVWSIQDELTGFRHYPHHKALWVAGDGSSYLFDSTFGLASKEEASVAAMEDCRVYSAEWGYDGSCRICQLDDGVPCTELEEGWGTTEAYEER